jgi:hypothetical protein
MKPQTKEKLRVFLIKSIDLIITGIVCAIISSLITTFILAEIEIKAENQQKINHLSSICIGSNREWVDQCFGTPQFSAEKEEYLLCAYTTDDFILQIAYMNDSVQAYLVTAFKSNDVVIRDIPMFFKNGIKIGSFSFHDFPQSPTTVSGFISNGASRSMYYESYYLAMHGNYLDYHIACFDYGFLKGSPMWKIPDEERIDDEVSTDILSPNSAEIITNRRKCYPNTYGVSAGGVDMENLLFSYDWFDSLKWLSIRSHGQG